MLLELVGEARVTHDPRGPGAGLGVLPERLTRVGPLDDAGQAVFTCEPMWRASRSPPFSFQRYPPTGQWSTRALSSRDHSLLPRPASLPLELQVLVRRRVQVADDETQARDRHAWPIAVQKRRLEERGEQDPLVHELLDRLQYSRAPLGIELTRLLLIEAVDVGEAAVGPGPGRDHERLDAGAGVAGGGATDPREGLELLLLVALLEASPLQAPELCADPHRLQEVSDGLRGRYVHHVGEDFACFEAPGVAGLGQELLGAGRIVGVGRSHPGEVEILRNDAGADLTEAEVLRFVDGLPVDRQVGGQPDPAIRPR